MKSPEETPHLSKELWIFLEKSKNPTTSKSSEFDGLGVILSWFKNSKTIQDFQNSLNYHFRNPGLLFEACCHRSFINELKHMGFDQVETNERLEFLGDSVSNLIVTTLITKKFTGIDEGKLSKLRGSIVCESGFYKIGKEMCLGEMILLGKGEYNRGGISNPASISDMFEALVGAIYKDSDFNTTAQVIVPFIKNEKFNFLDLKNIETFDYKSKLQEWMLKHFQALPDYESEEIKDGFKVTLKLNGNVAGSKSGHSKKQVMKDLAEEIYLTIENNNFDATPWR